MARRAPSADVLALARLLKPQEGLEAFIRRVNPNLPPPAHIVPLLTTLESINRGRLRLAVCMPPRHAKTITLRHFVAWLTVRFPKLVNAWISHTDDLARQSSRAIRDHVLEAGMQLRSDAAALNEWHTTEGGGLIAAGIESGLVGKGISGVLVMDDLVRNAEEADSASAQEKIAEWLTRVALTRLEPGASAILSMHRWSDGDIGGRIINGEFGDGWAVFSRPAIDTEGKALWPERFPVEELERTRAMIGDHSFSGLYQQTPRPKGGAVFREPARYSLADFMKPKPADDPAPRLHGCTVRIGVDPAASAKQHADWSVAVVMAMRGVGEKAEAWILDVYRAQVEVPELCKQMVRLASKWKAPVVVEAVGGFKAVPQMIRSLAPGLVVSEIQPRGDKRQRAQTLAAAWGAGRVYVPSDAPWADTFLDEILRFTGLPTDRHDDQVDAAVHAWAAQWVSRRQRARSPLRLPFG